jgi:hypothetical protein
VNTELRSFVGGLPLVVQLLESTDQAVQANVCGTIANIARDGAVLCSLGLCRSD